MTGILLLLVMGIWLSVCVWLAQRIGNLLPNRLWRAVIKLALFAALMPLPLIDEIVGGWQFSQLCQQYNTIQVDREKVKGSTIYYVPTDSIDLKNLWLPVRHQSWEHVYQLTGLMAMRYDSFHATGGWLIRTLRISESNAPLLFRGSCFPKENPVALMKSLNVTTLDRPVSNTKEEK